MSWSSTRISASRSRTSAPATRSCDGYLAWIDHVLGIRETAHWDLSTLDYDYDFRVLGSPGEVRRLIEERNAETGSAGMVAGYSWDRTWSCARAAS